MKKRKRCTPVVIFIVPLRLIRQRNDNNNAQTASHEPFASTMKHDNMEHEFLAMIEENQKTLYKVSLMYSDGPEHQQDIYQDIVLNLWTSFPTFRGESKTSTWVYRIALNTCVSELRKKSSRPLTTPLTYDLDSLIDDDGAYREQVRELYRLISRLSELERAIILLWLDEKSYDEIASILGITPSNVGVKINRIKEKLRKMNKEQGIMNNE